MCLKEKLGASQRQTALKFGVSLANINKAIHYDWVNLHATETCSGGHGGAEEKTNGDMKSALTESNEG